MGRLKLTWRVDDEGRTFAIPDELLRAIRRAVDRGARVASISSGAFVRASMASCSVTCRLQLGRLMACEPRPTGSARRSWRAATPRLARLQAVSNISPAQMRASRDRLRPSAQICA